MQWPYKNKRNRIKNNNPNIKFKTIPAKKNSSPKSHYKTNKNSEITSPRKIKNSLQILTNIHSNLISDEDGGRGVR